MSIVGPLPNNIQDGQIADAVPVMANYQWIIDQINANGASTAFVGTAIATAIAPLGPAGGTTQIQFNSSSAFAGSALLTWDGNNVTIGNTSSPGSGNGLLAAGAITSTHNSTVTGVTGASLRYDSVDGLGYITCFNWVGSAYEPFALASTTVAMQNATGGAYKAQLDLNGSWLVGYTSTNSPTYLLQVNSQIFATNATIATSDATVKENIQPLGEASDIVRSLKPVTFNFIDHDVHNFADHPQIGFLAQDVQESLKDQPYLKCIIQQGGSPGCHVEEVDDELDKNGKAKVNEFGHPKLKVREVVAEPLLGMADTKLIPLLVKAWQELDAKFTALSAKVAP
jgi:hypothetical protein